MTFYYSLFFLIPQRLKNKFRPFIVLCSFGVPSDDNDDDDNVVVNTAVGACVSLLLLACCPVGLMPCGLISGGLDAMLG